MIRKIIHINEEKCNGCGACASACHEGAIQMINGKAELIREDYCDGLGDCLPACPTGAITFEEREAAAYDAAAVQKHLAAKEATASKAHPVFSGCPGQQARQMTKGNASSALTDPQAVPGELTQWPVQIQLAPVNAPYFSGANLLIAADCTAYAYGDFHRRFIRDHITLIGCPKLDPVDYTEKLTQIIQANDIQSLTIVRMEVPCCGGIERAATNALKASGKWIPWQVVTIGIDGTIKE
ncbi:4Fe-4S binding protein [uncultured Merdimonas sp.]|uniref:ATP-binding protein n=1 Tax=uncultured Merdimonas sp. TaxID=2023269 RepID=UPI003208C922